MKSGILCSYPPTTHHHLCCHHTDSYLVLLEKREGKCVWDVPGGSIEVQETSQAVAWRKLCEETSLFSKYHNMLGEHAQPISVQLGASHTYGLFMYEAPTHVDIGAFKVHGVGSRFQELRFVSLLGHRPQGHEVCHVL